MLCGNRFFQGLPANVSFIGADLTGKHKGLWGLNTLYSELKAKRFDYVADFHHVLRTKYLCLRFRLANIPVASICKGRAGKEKLVRRRHKVLENQKSSFRRYADVLEKLGFPVLLNFSSIYGDGKGNFAEIEPVAGTKDNLKWIGIAPFAKHVGKIYPIELQEQIVAHFAADPKVKVFLFGGGKSEQEVFDGWVAKYPTVVSMIGKLNMRTEPESYEPSGCDALDGFGKYASGFAGQYSGDLCLGSYSSLCRIYGMETVAGQYSTTRTVVPPLLCVWAKTMLARRLCLPERNKTRTGNSED